MKKILAILLIFVSAISFPYIWFYSTNVLIYPNRTVNFETDENFFVKVFRFDVSKEAVKGIFSNGGTQSEFSIKNIKKNFYSLELPDVPGIYYVIVNGKESIARQILFVTDLKAFIASTSNQFYFSVYDLRNKKFLEKLYYFDNYTTKTINGPIFSLNIEKYKDKVFFLKNNIVILSNYGGWSNYPERKTVVFTDKPIYKPGDTIHVRINALKKDNTKYIPYQTKLHVSLKDPFNNIVYKDTFETDTFGGIVFDYKTTEEIITGNYTLIISENDEILSRYYLLVQDYTKPTYTLSLTANATQLIVSDTLQVKLNAGYLNGDPVKNAEVLFYAFKGSHLINKTKAMTNENGKATYNIVTKEAGYYRIQALIVDDSGIQNEKNIYAMVKADNVDIKGAIDNETLKLRITNISGDPLNGIGVVNINEKEIYFEVKNGYAEIAIPKNTWWIEVKFGKEAKVIYKSFSVSNSGIIVANKNSVKPGEKIKVAIDPKDDIGVLVTGEEKIRKFNIITKKSEIELTIPIDEISSTYFIEFFGLKYNDRVKINVNHDRVKTLKIKLDKTQYKPGEIANIKFENSKSLKIVSVVDEGIYLLSNAKSVVNQLYPEINYPSYELYTSKTYVYFNRLSEFEKSKKSHIFASTKESEERRIREYFPETAYWNPSLMKNEISLKTPDSITKWRVTAYEISKNYIAEGIKTFVVTKPFEVKIFAPEFLVEGDKVIGEIYVKNYTGKIGKVDVKLNVNNGMVDFNSGRYKIEKELKIPFTLKDFKEGDLKITAEASMLSEYDGIKLTIPVKPIYISKDTSKVVKIAGKKVFDKDAKIRVINNLKDFLEPSIKALIHYPYGCVEQTMSSFYPVLVAKSFIEYPNLDDIILKGLQRLLKFQHTDGGWGWWTFDDSDLFMTSYVLEGLYYTKKLGFFVPEKVILDGLEYLKNQPIDGYAAFILNLYGEKNIDFKARNVVDYVYTDPDKIYEIATIGKDITYIKSNPSNHFYTSIHLTSIAVRTLTRYNKYLDLRDKMINYLLNSKKGPFWYSTKDTAFAILAIIESQKLNDYKSNIIFEAKDNKICVSGNGFVDVESTKKIYAQNQFNDINLKNRLYKKYDLLYDGKYLDVFLPVNTQFIPINMSKISTPTFSSEIPEEIARIIIDGTPVLFVNNKLLIEGPFKFVGNNYYFEKGYYEINFTKNYDYEIHKGDVLKTSIFIDGTGEYLVVEEYLPACAQVLKNYVERTPDYEGKFSYRWYSNEDIWYSYKDVKKDKIVYFIRYLHPGKLEYYWRVTSEGIFHKKPTYVYNMYYEDTFAIGSLYPFNIK
ncbi:alpha-2-macroglobulin [Thermosipho melanesiensis]|uniref:Alpha-2-macroglobulin domain protein n=2 Tax=Thermosipho melanesiensis TaxID=46541 RepID=A6LJB2_THEM4|nr:MG2 domain-containing protein [Thermosipho melanesiensis]ABR30013.1 alpha-2-macroglobulin domain protein [Thermosipho melanesiensis BI429]APT73217.1 alpha-2-macroglobulin [Thermosipho melanesiensis]OOC38610.1 alpha-2-macroglobulin [Thermosipho melanesiensis]OOC40414.1 alpha-2-macroglobulin [Thermosipho melanesiensis]OOC40678.1 alpha-2-macroglobulin [Thermosipho melanesiensis]